MVTRQFQVFLEWDLEDQLWVTYGETRDEALDQTREAIVGYIEAAPKEGFSVGDRGDQ